MAKKGLYISFTLDKNIFEWIREALEEYPYGEQPEVIKIHGHWEDFPDWLRCPEWTPKEHETVLAGALDQQFNCGDPETWVEWEITIEK